MTDLVDIASSRVKAEIFRLHFGLRQPELYLRELARQSGLSLGTVQQELRRLTRVGVVSARKDGNRVCYRANAQHPVHGQLRSLMLRTDGLAGVLHQELQAKQVPLAFVLGSGARGDTRAASDVGDLGLPRGLSARGGRRGSWRHHRFNGEVRGTRPLQLPSLHGKRLNNSDRSPAKRLPLRRRWLRDSACALRFQPEDLVARLHAGCGVRSFSERLRWRVKLAV